MANLFKSASGRQWQKKYVDDRQVLAVSQKFNLHEFLARIIVNRNIELDEVENFLTPKIKNSLPDPFHLLDIHKAVDRVIEAMNNNELICIFADYDVDGATSASLLKNVLRELGVEAIIYVPDRVKEGYGPSKEAVRKLKDIGVGLLISVDCGSQAFDAFKLAKELSLDVVVIDHHMTGPNLPEAIAIVNPNRFDEDSQYTYLAAVGVTFLFCVALIISLKKQNHYQASQINLLNYLDLVALGTICDVVPLKQLNRAFVSQGLKILQNTKNIGIKALIDLASLNEPLRCHHLGYILGPRINAGGRVGKADSGCRLLTTTSKDEALSIANKLQEYNQMRQKIEHDYYLEALSTINDKNLSNFILVSGSWHPGVIGLIASKLKEAYSLPSFAVTFFDSEIAKGSCRSVKNVDIGAKILKARAAGLLIDGGGHQMAAGFSLHRDQLNNFIEFLEQEFLNDQTTIIQNSICEYDSEMLSESLNDILMNEIKKLAPFGAHNAEPVFLISDLYVYRSDIVGSKHVKCLLLPIRSNASSKKIDAIAFNAAYSAIGEILLSKNKVQQISVIGSVSINYWRGQEKLNLIIQDIIL